MASDARPDDAESATTGELTVTLQLVSPSVTVNRPLLFPDLPATTTVKQIKEKVRETLPTQPIDDHQRLIHRGRALIRDTDSLLDILGEHAIRQDKNQTMHLVVRDTTAPPLPSRTSPSRRSPAATQPRSTPAGPFTQHSGPQFRSTSSPLNAHPPTVNAPHAGQQHGSTPDLLSLMQTRNQRVAEAYARAREERNRNEANGQGGTASNNGRASPAMGFQYREAGGPARQTYRVETTVRTGPYPHQGHQGPQGPADGALSPADVHNMLRNADMAQATSSMTNAMHRSASGASLHSMYNRPLNQPGITLPMNYNGRATPDHSARSASGGSNTGAASSPSRPAVDVYILSSPEGPRALLVNNGTSETYYSPRLPMQPSNSRLRDFRMAPDIRANSPYVSSPGAQAPPPNQGQNQQNQANPQPQDQGQGQAQGQAQAQLQDGQNDRDNPQPPVLPPLLLQVWPHLWLMFRLGIFIWFFTSPNSTWSRWFSVVGLAVCIFIYTIGALNNIADIVWQPVRQHIQNLLPPMEGQPQRPQEGENHNPADMAARLIAQRERENWLQGQIRRIERAGLLFLASIAPGFAEEHIRNLENEARIERERIEAEAEAARRQQEEREQQEAEANGNGEGNENSNAEQPRDMDEPENGHQAPRPDPIAT